MLEDLSINGSVDSIGRNSGNIFLRRRSIIRVYNVRFEFFFNVRFSSGAIPENLAKPRRQDCSDLDTLPSESDKALEHWPESKPFL